MSKDGKYIYCIIESNEGRNFGSIGIGQRGDVVSTIGYNNMSAVISSSPMTDYVINRENMTAHERVIEKVMKDYTVLPVRFSTIAASAEEARNLLRKRHGEFKNLLKDMDNKIELGLKCLWKDMELIFQEIVSKNREIKRLKRYLLAKSSISTLDDRVGMGKKVQTALEEKKTIEAEKILNILKKISLNFCANKTYRDNMFLNAAFLVDKGREKEFDNRVDELERSYGDRVKFKYVGPVPPFNFVNIVVKW